MRKNLIWYAIVPPWVENPQQMPAISVHRQICFAETLYTSINLSTRKRFEINFPNHKAPSRDNLSIPQIGRSNG